MSTLASVSTKIKQPRSQPRKAKQVVSDAQRIVMLISTPDADSLGASIALKHHLLRRGKSVTLVSGNPIAANMSSAIVNEFEFRDPADLAYQAYDLIIVLDTANPYPQLVDTRRHTSFRLPETPPVLSIDHHRGNEGFARYNIWEPTASSTCEVVFRHFLAKDQLSADDATLLLSGLSSDTGHFKWMTSPKTFEIAARLQSAGGDLLMIVDHHFFHLEPKTLQMIQMWLSRLQYRPKLGYVSVSMTEQELAETGLSDAEYRRARSAFEAMFLQAIEGFPVGVFMVHNEHTVKGRLFGNNYRNNLDLTEVSRRVGGNGGGHFNASGFVVALPIDEAIHRLEHAMAELRQ